VVVAITRVGHGISNSQLLWLKNMQGRRSSDESARQLRVGPK